MLFYWLRICRETSLIMISSRLLVVFFAMSVFADTDINNPKFGKGGQPPPNDCSGEAGPKDFQDVYFKNINAKDCWDVTQTGCLSVHEARVKCPCVCNWRINKPGQEPPGRGYTAMTAAPATAAPATAAPATAAPATAGPTPSTGSSAMCFHADSIVQTKQGPRHMGSLVGEQNVEVMAIKNDNEVVYSPIRYWVHAEAHKSGMFIDLETEAGETISLSREHLIYTVDCESGLNREPIFASRVDAGNCVLVLKDNAVVPSRVVAKTESMRNGVFSPITAEGNIVADNVVASCYSYVENEQLQMIVYSYVDFAQKFVQQMFPVSLTDGMFGSAEDSHVNVPDSLWSFFKIAQSFVPAKSEL